MALAPRTRTASEPLQIAGLSPHPAERWTRLKAFLGLDRRTLEAMAATAEVLFRRGPELVEGTYDYLARFPETAAILGWTQEVDRAHLEERRRFFTVWLARTLGLDLSVDFAFYLFEAGKKHAGHGPRKVNVPPAYVVAAIGLVEDAFARFLTEARVPGPVMGPALSGWSRYLHLQLEMMLAGDRVARALDEGEVAVPVHLYGLIGEWVGVRHLEVHVPAGAPFELLLRKLFDYFPRLRDEALEAHWEAGEEGATWVEELRHTYRLRPGWNLLVNGRDVRFHGGLGLPLKEGDRVAVFPPGR